MGKTVVKERAVQHSLRLFLHFCDEILQAVKLILERLRCNFKRSARLELLGREFVRFGKLYIR